MRCLVARILRRGLAHQGLINIGGYMDLVTKMLVQLIELETREDVKAELEKELELRLAKGAEEEEGW